MILGLGVDIVELERMRRLHERFGERLAHRLLSSEEHAQYARAADPVRLLAKRFATKEAAAKALGTGLGDGVRLPDLETTHRDSGAPALCLHGRAAARADRLGAARSHVSVSDERTSVVAVVLLESA